MVALIIALLEHTEHATAVKECLTEAGHEVEIVTSFPDAMTLLSLRKFDLIISDVHLENGGTVFDFLRWVKARQRFREIPFVLVTVSPNDTAKYLSDAVRTAARLMGAAKYISMEKFDTEFLRNEIAELLPGDSDVQIATTTPVD